MHFARLSIIWYMQDSYDCTIIWFMPATHNQTVYHLVHATCSQLFCYWTHGQTLYNLVYTRCLQVNHYSVLVTTNSQNCLWFGLYTVSIIISALFGAYRNSQPKCFVIWYMLAVYYNCSIIWSPTHSQNGLIAWEIPAVSNCTLFWCIPQHTAKNCLLPGTCLLAVYHNSTIIWCMPQHTAKIVYYLVYACLLAVYHNSTVIWHTPPTPSQRLIVWHMTLFHHCAIICCMPPTHKIVSLAYNSCSSLHHYLVHGTNSWPDSVILGICWLFRTAQLYSIHLSTVPQHHY